MEKYLIKPTKNMTNWFLKISQLKLKNNPESSSEYVYSIYECEYKKFIISKSDIHPKRKENILKYLNNNITQSILYLKDYLSSAFLWWIDLHDTSNIEKWSEKRAQDAFGDERDCTRNFKIAVYDYKEFTGKNLDHLIFTISNNIEKFPNWNNYRLYLINLQNEDNSNNFNNEEEEFFELKKDASLYDAIEYMNINDESLFCEYRENDELVTEIYKIIAPFWFEKMEQQSFSKTLANVKNVYNSLKTVNPSNENDAIKKINLAIGTSHQNGDMTDYMNIDVSLLEKLTRGDFIQQWNNDLKEIGIKI